MGIRTLAAAAVVVTALGTSAFAGSSHNFNKQDKSNNKPSFNFGNNDGPSYHQNNNNNQNLFSFFNDECEEYDLDNCDFFGGKNKKTTFSFNWGKKNKSWNNDCNKPSWNWCDKDLDWDCEEDREPSCDEPQNGDCPVVPVPAAAWTGMAMLGGLALVRKARGRKQAQI